MTTALLDDETPYGVPWPELFALRDGLAYYWYRRQGCRYPLEEYQSAGNLALADALHQYDATRGKPFRDYASFLVNSQMRQVMRRQSGKGNAPHGKLPTYQIELRNPKWWSAYAPTVPTLTPALDALADATMWLATYPRPIMVQALIMDVQGYSEDEIAQATQLTPCTVRKGLQFLRENVKAWATGTIRERTADRTTQRMALKRAKRAPHQAVLAAQRSSQVRQAKALRASGQRITAIAATLGTARSTVRKLLAVA